MIAGLYVYQWMSLKYLILGSNDAKKPRKTIVDGMRDGLSNASKGAAIMPQPMPNTLCAVDAM